MPLGSEQDLNSFYLGAVQLQSTMAPEQMTEAVTAAFRFFFFKTAPDKSNQSKKAIVQPGRVTPDPMTLDFRFNGDTALDQAQYLKGIVTKQQEIALRWMNGKISYKGYLTRFEFRYAQKEVTGTLTYQPTQDLSAAPAGDLTSKLIQRSQDVQGFLQGISDAINGVSDTIQAAGNNVLGGLSGNLSQIQALYQDSFNACYAVIAQVNSAIGLINQGVLSFGDAVSFPFQFAGQVSDSLTTAINLLPNARTELMNKILSPQTPLLQGTNNYLAVSAGLSACCNLDDLAVDLSDLNAAILPQPTTYVVQDSDTLYIIATIFNTTIGVLEQLNPGLNENTLTVGNTINVPTT